MKLRQVGDRVRSYSKYLSDFRSFDRRHLSKTTGFPALRWDDRYVVLGEDTQTTEFDRHYVYHTAWAARVLSQTRPELHHDFASQVYFCALVSAFVPVRFYDYRPAPLELEGLDSRHADLTNLPFEDGSLGSVSCMHVVEHIGLGRYGDPIDPEGDRRAAAELQRVTAPGGDLLFVAPVGKPRICFNAHRVYSYEIVLEMFADCELVEFSMVPDAGAGPDFLTNADPELVARQDYACGCFWLRKKNPQ